MNLTLALLKSFIRGSRGGTWGSQPHPRTIGFLSNTGPALLKSKPAFNVGPFKKVPVFIKLSTCGEAKLIIDYTTTLNEVDMTKYVLCELIIMIWPSE